MTRTIRLQRKAELILKVGIKSADYSVDVGQPRSPPAYQMIGCFLYEVFFAKVGVIHCN